MSNRICVFTLLLALMLLLLTGSSSTQAAEVFAHTHLTEEGVKRKSTKYSSKRKK